MGTNKNLPSVTPIESEPEYNAILQRAVALLPWSHNILLINKKLGDNETLYYAEETIKKGWNRDLLLNAIKLKMHKKQLRLVDKVKLFLMELGKGFTFIGNQYPLEFNGKTTKRGKTTNNLL